MAPHLPVKHWIILEQGTSFKDWEATAMSGTNLIQLHDSDYFTEQLWSNKIQTMSKCRDAEYAACGWWLQCEKFVTQLYNQINEE